MAHRFDEHWDVVVAGCGYAGAMAAIAAHDAGARVLIVEKMPDAGGISVCSAGGVRITSDAQQAFAYLKQACRGTTPDDVLKALADGMAGLAGRIKTLAQAAGGTVETRPAHGNYPFDGHRSFGFAMVTALDGHDEHPAPDNIKGGADGYRLFKVLERNLASRAIEVRTGTRARELVTGGTGAITGVVVERAGRTMRLGAAGGVILACGGFEADADMQRQFWPGGPAKSAAFAGNTGDGIRMAQKAGAGLWHMWHYHGTYGFHHPDPDYPFAIRTKRFPDWVPGEPPASDVRMPWILLDRSAARFMNEYDPYLQDTGARPLAFVDPQTQDYARSPAFLIADKHGCRQCAFGRPTWHQTGLDFDWSKDNQAEVELGILERAYTLAGLADIIGVRHERLEATLARWNAQCAAGRDDDFKRPGSTMMEVATPPFYAGRVWPVVSNTQGGPVHDAAQQILDAGNAPIAGLYAAGELGSAFGFLYMSGGNLAECFTGGERAGTNAARRAIREMKP